MCFYTFTYFRYTVTKRTNKGSFTDSDSVIDKFNSNFLVVLRVRKSFNRLYSFLISNDPNEIIEELEIDIDMFILLNKYINVKKYNFDKLYTTRKLEIIYNEWFFNNFCPISNFHNLKILILNKQNSEDINILSQVKSEIVHLPIEIIVIKQRKFVFQNDIILPLTLKHLIIKNNNLELTTNVFFDLFYTKFEREYNEILVKIPRDVSLIVDSYNKNGFCDTNEIINKCLIDAKKEKLILIKTYQKNTCVIS